MSQKEKIDGSDVQIHQNVLAEIVFSSLQDVEGIHLCGSPSVLFLKQLFGQKVFPGIFISVNAQQEVSIEIRLLVKYGMNIPDLARQMQDVVKQALSKITNMQVKDININVQGIERGNK